MLKNRLSFIAAAAQSQELLYVSFRDKETEKDEESHSIFGGYKDGKGGIMKNNIQDWNTQAMCVIKMPDEKMIAIAGNGEIFTYIAGKSTKEQIKPKPYNIRNLGVIDGYAYACGIDRQVFKRVEDDKWQAIHAPDSSNMKGTHGFEAIAGYSENDIYAIGWKGEIWHYDGNEWTQEESPTTVILTAIICASDANVYAAGQNGTLLQRENGKWQAINKGGYIDDIWSMCWFNSKLYAATMGRILVLEGNKLVPVNMGDDVPGTCYHLTSAEGVMWSIGYDDIFSFDSKKWTRVE